MKPLVITLFLALGGSTPALAAEWHSSEFQVLHGGGFREPFNPDDVAKTTLTLNDARGYTWGSSFVFLDYLKSDANDARAEEFYGEAYLYPSLGKLLGRDFRTGPLRDVSLALGVNWGDKSTGANPRIFLPGVTLNFDVPGFAFFDLSLLGYLDRGRFNGVETTCNADSWQITPTWKRPFRLGALSLSFEGFVDVIGAHGSCTRQVVAQPQLRLDLGDLWGQPGKVYAGVEYQYWHNKFGIDGLHEHLPQALLVWGF